MSNNRPPSQANRSTTPTAAKPVEEPTTQVTGVGATPEKVDPPKQQPRGPKFIWLVKPSFTMGDARAYFTKEDALKDFGQPLEKWTDHGHIATIKFGPKWDPFECEWELEKIQVR